MLLIPVIPLDPCANVPKSKALIEYLKMLTGEQLKSIRATRRETLRTARRFAIDASLDPKRIGFEAGHRGLRVTENPYCRETFLPAAEAWDEGHEAGTRKRLGMDESYAGEHWSEC